MLVHDGLASEPIEATSVASEMLVHVGVGSSSGSTSPSNSQTS